MSMRGDYHHPQRHPLSLRYTDAAGRLDKSARNGDAGYDPVIEAEDLEKILGLSLNDCENRDRKARRGVV